MVVSVPGPPWVRIRTVSKVVSPPTTIRIIEVIIELRSCGRVMLKNCRTRPAPSTSRRLVEHLRDGPGGALVDQRVERRELPHARRRSARRWRWPGCRTGCRRRTASGTGTAHRSSGRAAPATGPRWRSRTAAAGRSRWRTGRRGCAGGPAAQTPEQDAHRGLDDHAEHGQQQAQPEALEHHRVVRRAPASCPCQRTSGAPMPSQLMKDSTTTAISGTTAKSRKNTVAGSAQAKPGTGCAGRAAGRCRTALADPSGSGRRLRRKQGSHEEFVPVRAGPAWRR